MNSQQGTLFAERPSIDQRFDDWIAKNYRVYEKFVEIARLLKSEGRTHWSADAICHVCRWELRLAMTKEGGFRLNDHFVSRLARKSMDENPDLAGFFETRKLRERS